MGIRHCDLDVPALLLFSALKLHIDLDQGVVRSRSYRAGPRSFFDALFNAVTAVTGDRPNPCTLARSIGDAVMRMASQTP